MKDSGSARAATSADDRELLARAQAGDLAAFEVVVAGRLDGLWRLARALLGADDAAADTVEVALLAAWRELPRLDDLGRFDAWLDRILISECRMRLGPSGGRASASPAPPGLLAATMARIHETPPRPPRPPMARGRPDVVPWVVLTLGMVALVAATAVGVNLIRARADPGVATAATASPATTATAPAAQPPSGSPEASSMPDTVLDGEVGVGGLAIVTLKGNDLRVRSAPGTDDTSRMLTPLLPAGTRMLVVAGPVEANGLRWWEIQTDSELLDMFGWVADGRGGQAWIAPVEPRCVSDPDVAAVTGMSRIDFLICNGSTEVTFEADAASLWDASEVDGDCGWVLKRDGCDVGNAWLLLASTVVRVALEPGDQHDLVVAVPPDVAQQLALLERHRTLQLTVAMDSPDSQGCRIRASKTGRLLLPHDQAVTICRRQFVVQGVAFRQ